jgi:hypothetical protein
MDEQRIATSPGPADSDRDDDDRPGLSRVDVTLDHLGRLCARLEQAEQRFKQMTDECSHVLDGLVAVDRRHATALATLNDRLGDWCNIERKLLEESARRIERFERGVEHEWTALRRLHEEPIVGLRDQADKLRLACLDAARLARQRLDAAEQSYALQTRDFERRMTEWTRHVLETAAGRDLPGAGANGGSASATEIATASVAPVEPWPLDGVAQLHQELRSGAQPAQPRPASPPAVNEDVHDYGAQVVGTPPRASENAPTVGASPQNEHATRVAPTLAPAVNHRVRSRIVWAVSAIALGILVFVMASYVSQMQRRLGDLESKASQAAVPPPSNPPAEVATPSTPDVSAPRTPDAQQSAQRAATIVNILAAPDLVRYDLAGVGPGQGAYGQVLWSRSLGMALTAVRLPARAGKVYCVWVSRENRTAHAGVLGSDGVGTLRLIVNGPLTLPRPGTIVVTLESAATVERPTGPIYMTRVPTS